MAILTTYYVGLFNIGHQWNPSIACKVINIFMWAWVPWPVSCYTRVSAKFSPTSQKWKILKWGGGGKGGSPKLMPLCMGYYASRCMLKQRSMFVLLSVCMSVCYQNSSSMRAIQVHKLAQMAIKGRFLGFKFARFLLGFRVTVRFTYLDGSFEQCGRLQGQPCSHWILLQLESFNCPKVIAKDDSRIRWNKLWSYEATHLACQRSDWRLHFCTLMIY